MSCISTFTGDQLAILSSVVAVLLSKDLTADEQNILGNFIVSVGSSMLTIAAANQTNASGSDSEKVRP